MRKVILVGVLLAVGGCDWVDELKFSIKARWSGNKQTIATCYTPTGKEIYNGLNMKDTIVSYGETDSGYYFITEYTGRYETNGTCVFNTF